MDVVFCRFSIERKHEKMRDETERLRAGFEEQKQRLASSRLELEKLEWRKEKDLRVLQEKEKELELAKVGAFFTS